MHFLRRINAGRT